MGNLVSLTELCSTGKSGSFFYFTPDSIIFILFYHILLKVNSCLKLFLEGNFIFLEKS